jgi:predicted transcriptional regulator
LTLRTTKHRFSYMALQLTPALEQRLEHLAAETNRSSNELAQSVMEAYVEDHEDLVAAVKEADEEFERGEFLPHEEVVAQFAKHFAKA